MKVNDGGKPRRVSPLRRAYAWALRAGEHPAGPWVLVLFAIMEAFVFPAPTEALFLALALARPRRSWALAALATAASVAGGVVGYHVGAFFFDRVGRPVLEWYDLAGQVDTVREVYRDNVYLALGTSGYTPIPYMLYTIAAGALGIPLGPFVVGSLVGRGIKYAILAALTYYLGPAVRTFLDRYVGWVVAAVAVVLLLAVLVLKT